MLDIRFVIPYMIEEIMTYVKITFLITNIYKKLKNTKFTKAKILTLVN